MIQKKETPKDNIVKEKITVKRPYISKKHLKKNRKRVKIYWKKVTDVSGYEIQYSTSKKFTKKTTKQKRNLCYSGTVSAADEAKIKNLLVK